MTVREYIEKEKENLGEYSLGLKDIFGQGSTYYGGGAEQALSEKNSEALNSNFIRACEIKSGTIEIIYMKSLELYDIDRLIRDTEVLRDKKHLMRKADEWKNCMVKHCNRGKDRNCRPTQLQKGGKSMRKYTINGEKAEKSEAEKAIADCVKEGMCNVRIELKNGNTVRVSAHAVKNFSVRGQIDEFNVNKDDRKLLDKIKNSTIIEKPITARDIKRITHRRRTLFEV